MPISLTVNNQVFEYPISGDSPGWGEQATDWAAAVTVALQNLQSSTDIPQTSFTIANNVSVFTNVNGLNFNTGTVRAAFIQYSIYRTSTSNPSGNIDGGVMTIVYDNLAGSGSKWTTIGGPISGGTSGVTFNVTDAGQFQYKSTDLGSGHSGVIKFMAKTLAQ